MKKFQTFRRGKVLLFLTFFVALIAFSSCKEEMQFAEVTVGEPTSQKVIEAMKWFDDNQKSASPEATHLKMMKPVWEKAIVMGKIVEVPYKVDGKFYLPSLTKEFKNIGRQKLIIENNGIKGFRSYIVSYIPTKNFTGKIKNLNILNFRHQMFDGMIRIFNLNKKPIDRYYYQNGKQSQSLSILNTRGDCYTTEWQCWEFDGEWTCREIYVEIPCEDDDDDDDNDDDPCNSASPPAYCNDSGGCDSPNPPAYCNDNGDPCMSAIPPPTCDGGPAGDPDPDPDPCKGSNPPADCDKCKCKNISSSVPIGFADFNFLWAYRCMVDINLAITQVNCNAGSYQQNLTHDITNFAFGSVEFPSEVVLEWHRASINPSKPECGVNVTWYGNGTVTFNGTLGPAGEPLSKTVSWDGWYGRNLD